MASYGKIINIPGLLAGADLSAKQYKAVKLASTAGEVVASAAVTDVSVGILQNDPADGEAASIAGAGSITLAVAATAITAGAGLSANTTGVITYTTATFARALEAAAAAGDRIMIQVIGAQ